MTLAQLYAQSRRRLTGPTADFDLSQLFRAQFGDTPGLRRAGAEVPDEEAFVFSHKIRRLAEGYPLQYLLGEWEFYSIPLSVGEGVLIPRPDTETLVDAALGLAAPAGQPVVADLCAGSGAVALAVAANLPQAKLYAVELSPEALRYCRANVRKAGLQARIEVLEADVLEPLALPPLDFILSNPPYLTAGELQALSPQVRWEPAMALDGGPDGLTFYRALARRAAELLRPGGRLLVEVGWRQAEEVTELFQNAGLTELSVYKDLAGIDRCIAAVRP